VKLFDRLRALLHLDDPPWRLALALSVGVFISCTPLYGAQTLLALLVATVFRLNKAVTVLGTWLNLPWFAPFMYAAALKIGARVLAEVRNREAESLAVLFGTPLRVSLHDLVGVLPDISLALVIGTTLVGLVAGTATYVVAFGIIRRRRARANGGTSSQRAA
jgi:uncharacterized protein (DUF2062 family)